MSKKKKKINKPDQSDTNVIDDAVTNEIDEMVDSLYGDDGKNGIIQKPITRQGSRVLYAVFVAIIAFLGGIIGELLINNYLHYNGYDLASVINPVSNEAVGDEQVIIFKKEEVAAVDSQLKVLLENTEQVVVGIYLKRGGASLVDQLYRAQDKVGNALVLTSDGWLATTVTGMPDEPEKELVVITEQNKVLPIEKIVLDPVSDIVFIKVTADNLKVIKFAEETSVYPGLEAVLLSQSLLDASAESVVTTVAQVRKRQVSGFAENFFSTEKYQTFITIKNAVNESYAGSPLLDTSGGIIGLYYADGHVVPAYHFMSVFDRLLRNGTIDRSFIGLRYLDLAYSVGLPSILSEDLTAGALVFGDRDHSITAVASGSPAAESGLTTGDIITKVNNDSVDARHSLTDLLQEYRIGDVVKLIVQNSGVVREVDLLLTEVIE